MLMCNDDGSFIKELFRELLTQQFNKLKIILY